MMEIQNKDGEWVQAIPEPLRSSWWFVCRRCQRKMRSLEYYRGHYALVHILKLD